MMLKDMNSWMPAIENIELAARLSAFDSFLFLADDISNAGNYATDGMIAASTKQMPIQSVSENRVYETNEEALSKVTLQLIQRKQRSHEWPTVKVLPGIDVVVERNEQSIRKVPFEESIVSLVPGSIEESKELADRMGAFDDYMFLLDDGNDSSIAKGDASSVGLAP